MNTVITKPCIACIRVSTDTQDAAPQENRIKAWATLNSYEIVATYGRSQTGESATIPIEEREAAHAIAHAIQLGCPCVFDSLDRLSRIVPDLYAIAKRVLKSKANIICLSDGMDLREAFSTPVGKLFFGLRSLFAEFERDNTALRTKKKLADLKSQGRRTSGAVPYGYRLDMSRPEHRGTLNGQEVVYYPHLIPHLPEQEVLRQMQELSAQYGDDGRKWSKIARDLAQRGVRNRAGKPFDGKAIWAKLRGKAT